MPATCDHSFVRAGDLPASLPASTHLGRLGTYPLHEADGLNQEGRISGATLHRKRARRCHGFVREPLGNITEFDAPGAGTGPGYKAPSSEHKRLGGIGGYYTDAEQCVSRLRARRRRNLDHVRCCGGRHRLPRAPSPPGLTWQGRSPDGYADASNVVHGFVRAPDGEIHDVRCSGRRHRPGSQGTVPYSNNPAGAIIGYYFDSGA